MWAGLVAIADQGRTLAGLGSLDGATQTLPALYELPQSDFNDIITGNNGFAAGPGYDLVTGRGSPIANQLIPALAGVQSISGRIFQDNNGDGIFNTGDLSLAGVTVDLDASNGTLVQTTTTNAQGQYVFNSVPLGTYDIEQVLPVNEVQIPASQADVLTVASAAITGQNFADFPPVISDANNGDSDYLVLDATGTDLEIFSGSSAQGTPLYQVPLADLPSLTLNLSGADQTLDVDFSNGDPIPAGGITLNGDAAQTTTLNIIGQNPSQTFSMSDTQLTLAGGGTINYAPLGTLGVSNATVQYGGDFATIQQLDVNAGSTFIFG
jgi:hypothetical protein